MPEAAGTLEADGTPTPEGTLEAEGTPEAEGTLTLEGTLTPEGTPEAEGTLESAEPQGPVDSAANPHFCTWFKKFVCRVIILAQ